VLSSVKSEIGKRQLARPIRERGVFASDERLI
jgi:hypothetical protein